MTGKRPFPDPDDDFTTIALCMSDGLIHEVTYLGLVRPRRRCDKTIILDSWNPDHPIHADKPKFATCIRCISG